MNHRTSAATLCATLLAGTASMAFAQTTGPVTITLQPAPRFPVGPHEAPVDFTVRSEAGKAANYFDEPSIQMAIPLGFLSSRRIDTTPRVEFNDRGGSLNSAPLDLRSRVDRLDERAFRNGDNPYAPKFKGSSIDAGFRFRMTWGGGQRSTYSTDFLIDGGGVREGFDRLQNLRNR